MPESDSTCWTMIRGAAAGHAAEREEFARRYGPVIRAFLGARWRGSPFLAEMDDAAQEVFLDCVRRGGPLERVDETRSAGFRGYLYGVVRNVARRTEEAAAKRRRERQPEGGFDLAEVRGREDSLATVFDREWATAMMKEAAALQASRAREQGTDAMTRVEILRMRFVDDLPVREIAARLRTDPSRVHHQYAQAREEFKASLAEVVRFHHGGGGPAIDAECSRLLEAFG